MTLPGQKVHHYLSSMLKVVIIDDNISIRESIKSRVGRRLKEDKKLFEIFSSDNGIEGLGFIYTISPDLVIIDTTLPRYSGKEVVDFVLQNNKIDNSKLIIIHQGDIEIDPASGINVINKQDKNFLDVLEKLVEIILKLPVKKEEKRKEILEESLVKAANTDDRLMYMRTKLGMKFSLIGVVPWMLLQLVEACLFTLFRLFVGSVHEGSIEQKRRDAWRYRVRVYPTMVVTLSTLLIILFQVAAIVGGGMVIFGYRIDAIYALENGEKGIEFNEDSKSEFTFDANYLVFGENGVKLKAVVQENIPEAPVEEPVTPEPEPEPEPNPQPEQPPVEEPPVEEPAPQPDPEPTPEPTPPPAPVEPPPAEEPPVEEPPAEPESVLGAETTATYPTDKPSIETKDGVIYSKLEKIFEVSSVNNEQTSGLDPESDKAQIENLYDQVKITYQLSPDGQNWYYYSTVEARWAKTTQGASSSNIIQEVNKDLASFEEELGSGKLYLKVFLHSQNGTETPMLKKVVVERENAPIDEVVTELPEEPQLEEETVSALDWGKLEVEVFTASYYNGNKIVLGKVLLKDKSKKGKYEVDSATLSQYKAKVFYNNSDEVIGETDLYINSRGEIEFLLKTPNRAGGFVQAQVIQLPPVQGEEPETAVLGASTEEESVLEEQPVEEIPVEEQTEEPVQPEPEPEPGFVPNNSPRSLPVENSTFTVDSTDDQADLALNGICITSAGTCTLRAAIAEANNVVGSDNIFFNIPTSDAGYRDFDSPDTSSSGDSSGGDDYWTIRPATVLPTISADPLIIDGTTQTTNQSNTNTLGPEIELNGVNKTFNGINTTGSTLSIKGMVVNNFQIGLAFSGLTGGNIEGNYIGTNIKATAAQANSSLGIRLQDMSNVVIGGLSDSQRNIISGNTGGGIVRNGSSTCQNNSVINNYIGVDRTGTSAIANGLHGFDNGNCDFTVVRNNIMSGHSVGVGLRFQNAQGVVVAGNKIGTDVTGMVAIPNASSGGIFYRGGPVGTTKAIDAVIGGDSEADRNIISGNNALGISVGGGDVAEDMIIKGNYIGVAADGITPLANTSGAISFSRGTNNDIENNVLYAPSGISPIFLNATTPLLTGATITNNKITSAGSKTPIDILLNDSTNSVTPNDSGDVDAGPNEGMNFPYITDVVYLGSNQFEVTGTLSDANAAEDPYEIEICVSSEHASGHGGCLETVDSFSLASATYWTRTVTVSGATGDEKFSALATNVLGSTSEFSSYSDANPVLQEDGSYVITVDSTSDEDNVATAGLDDGTGAYSGGGTNGADGIANGKTSLREAMIVANNHAGHDYIHFDIPTSDSGYNSTDGYFTITFNNFTDLTDDSGVTIDGYTQSGASRNTAAFGQTLDAVLKIRVVRNTSIFRLMSDNNHITGLNIALTFNQNYNVEINAGNNNWVEGNFIGSNFNGTSSTGNYGQNIVTNGGSDNTFGTNGDGSGDAGERNLFMGETTQYKILIQTGANNNNVIAGNYLGVDKTSRTCVSATQGRSMIAVFTGTSNRIGSDLNGTSDNEESNIMGCVNTNARGVIQTGTATNNIIQGNYIGTNTYGDHLSTFEISGIRDNGVAVGNIIKNNVIRFNGSRGINLISAGSVNNTIQDNVISDNGLLEIDLLGGSEGLTRTDWYNQDWDYRKRIYFDNEDSDTDLENIPVLVKLTTSNITYANMQSDGDDLRFTDSDGTTLLDYEIESFNAAGNSFIWVNVPKIDKNSSSDSIYMYYGNTAATSAQDESGVWGSDYLGVWHLNEDPTVSVADSSPIGTTLTNQGALTAANQVTGVIGGSVRFDNPATDGSNYFLKSTGSTAYKLGPNQDFSVSAWINTTFTSDYEVVVTNGQVGGGVPHFRFLLIPHSDPQLTYFQVLECNGCGGNSKSVSSTTDVVDGNWHYLTGIREGSKVSLYIDGIFQGSVDTPVGNVDMASSTEFLIGSEASRFFQFNGQVDEVRVTNNVLSTDRITADYAMVSGNFTSFSAEQTFNLQVTVNDAGDADTGPNDLQNYPEITSVQYIGNGQYKIKGEMDGNSAEAPFEIEICEADGHSSGYGGCIDSLGFTEANSPWEKTVTISGSNGLDGRIFSVLATNANGSTSEFGPNFEAVITNPGYSIVIPTEEEPAEEEEEEEEEPEEPEEETPTTPEPEIEEPPLGDLPETVDVASGVRTIIKYVLNSIAFIPLAMALGIMIYTIATMLLSGSAGLVDMFARLGLLIPAFRKKKKKDERVNQIEEVLFYKPYLMILSLMGFVYTLIITFIYPSIINYLLVLVYICIALVNLFIYLRRRTSNE